MIRILYTDIVAQYRDIRPWYTSIVIDELREIIALSHHGTINILYVLATFE